MTNEQLRKNMKVVQGRVVSDKMEKTRVVLLVNRVRHSLFKKSILRSRKIKVHDENNEAKLGDIISAVEIRPLSKHKRHRLYKILERSK